MDIQAGIMSQFSQVINNEKNREDLNFIESLIEKSRTKSSAWKTRMEREKKNEIRYTHNRPINFEIKTA